MSTKLVHGFWKNNDNSSCKTYFIRFKMMFWFWNPCLILCLLSNSPHPSLDRSLPVAVLTFRQKSKSIFFYARFASNCPLTIVATDQERGAGSVSFVIREENVWVKFWANVGISATENVKFYHCELSWQTPVVKFRIKISDHSKILGCEVIKGVCVNCVSRCFG